MSFAFKRFNFFQPHQNARHGFPPNASCVVPGGPLLWVGTESGSVCVLDSRLSLIGSFNAHGHKVLEVLWLERRPLLVTVGVEEPGCSSTTVKLWQPDKLLAAAAAADGPGGAGGGGAVGTGPATPAGVAAAMTPLRVTKVFGSHNSQQYPESPVTAAAAAEGGGGSAGGGASGLANSGAGGGGGGGGGSLADSPVSLTVALGLASGHVVVLTGEVAPPGQGGKARLSHSRRLSARPDQGDLWSVTGLELTGTSDLLSLFVVTESQTLCFHLQTNTKTVLDPQGSAVGHCCCLRPGGALLTVARAEGLYDYTADTRAGCTVLEGVKQRLTTFGRYLVVVTREDTAAAGLPAASNLLSGGGLGLGGGPMGLSGLSGGPGGGPGGGGSSCLQLADVRTKLLAGSFVLQGLSHVFCAWGAVHAVTAAGAVWSYREIDLASQLEALLKRSMHKLALDVARAFGPGAADAATLANIHQRWGDHLYGKGEYDAAMAQYLETVGQLEPSYVIRRFLDAQRIHNLTAYLEVMHERGLATCDHTTLLLNCYTKLKDIFKLDAFIRRGGVGGPSPGSTSAGAGAAAATATAPGGAGHFGGATAAAAVAAGASTTAAGAGGADGRGRGRPRRNLTSATAAANAASAAATAAAAAPALTARGTSKQSSKHIPAAEAPAPSPALRFDADTAVRVLRGAGYAEHALWVADAAGQIDAVLDILLDELQDADEAITYLEELPRSRRAEALKKYGKALIGMRPEEATRLIMDLCCGPPGGPPVSAAAITPMGSGMSEVSSASGGPQHAPAPPRDAYYLASVSDFAHLYSGEPTALMLLCEFILNTNAAFAAAAAASASSASSHGGGGGGGGGAGGEEDDGSAAAERARAYERLLYHTLLELYLSDNLWQQQHQQQGSTTTATANTTSTSTSTSNGGVSAPHAPSSAAPSPAHTKAGGKAGGKAQPPAASGGSQHRGGGGAAHAAAAAVTAAASAPASAGAAAAASSHQQQLPPADLDAEARRNKALELLARGWPPHVHYQPHPDHLGHLGPGPAGGRATGGGASAMHGPSYDPDHALVLCRTHGFRRGLLFLYDRLRLPREALQVYMSSGDYPGLIAAVLKYGDAARGGDPVLWSEVLEYFVAQHDANPPTSDCSAQIMQVVEHVERSGVLPPLVVLQTLSRSRRLPLSLVRGYMARALQRDTAAVAQDRESVTKLAAETAQLRDEVNRLRTQPRVFQNSRCSASGAPLELPVVHFLCGHSYNLRQLGDNDRECPLCAPDQRRVAEIRRNMQATSMQPERFFAELRQAADGFSVVAEHFGRGLMNATPAAAAVAAVVAGAAAGAPVTAGQPGTLL